MGIYFCSSNWSKDRIWSVKGKTTKRNLGLIDENQFLCDTIWAPRFPHLGVTLLKAALDKLEI